MLASRRTCGPLLIIVLTWIASSELAGLPPAEGQEREALERAEAPFLWVIEGDKPSYLFGTIHSADERCTTLHPWAQEAFDGCDQLFVELAPTDQLGQLAAIQIPDRRIVDVVPRDLLRRIDAQLADMQPNLSHEMIQISIGTPKIYAWALLLPNLEAQLKGDTSAVLDLRLINDAARAGKPVGSLENPRDQLSGMDRLTQAEQLAFLEDALIDLEEGDESGDDPEAELVEIYLKGDPHSLERHFRSEFEESSLEPELVEKVISAMLDERNKRIADTIIRQLRESPDQSCFFAAGAAHFLGEESVQSFLIEQGFEVRLATKALVDAPR